MDAQISKLFGCIDINENVNAESILARAPQPCMDGASKLGHIQGKNKSEEQSAKNKHIVIKTTEFTMSITNVCGDRKVMSSGKVPKS